MKCPEPVPNILEVTARINPAELAIYLFMVNFPFNNQVVPKSMIIPANPTTQNLINLKSIKLSIFTPILNLI